MKSPTQNNELTQDEAELYDRQIRLWGVESQKRLRCARVLIIGVQGYGCEIAKNMILSGVHSVTLLDGGVVTEEDACAQFLAPRDQLGQNRAEASLARAQQLNPMVQVTADPQRVQDKPDTFFDGFDVVCATKCPTEQLVRIDNICRNAKVLFFCGDVFGMFGYMFADLGLHTYETERISYKVNKGAGEGGKKGEAGDKVTVMVKETSTFAPLEDALNLDWTTEANIQRRKKMDPSYFLMKVLLRFREEQGRDPSPGLRSQDLAILRELSPEILPEDLLLGVFAEVAPVCAILGGVTAQELIKALSMRDAPHNNFFFFNPAKCLGFIQHIASP